MIYLQVFGSASLRQVDSNHRKLVWAPFPYKKKRWLVTGYIRVIAHAWEIDDLCYFRMSIVIERYARSRRKGQGRIIQRLIHNFPLGCCRGPKALAAGRRIKGAAKRASRSREFWLWSICH